ncbi:sugar phosphorylase [Paraferrimonas haliotis]|uniref:Sucrose phosphorylase n=1 Tax=Paraferrimonas haliotis TaxID=2013866 RepID=A0AA37WW19_9GAMM|nr:sugar phosphorylase [Paraferrimonas haliotis]GLS83088.1 sucrose phosphorylase [Paraferrimonas haliotis]
MVVNESLHHTVQTYLRTLYPDHDPTELAHKVLKVMRLENTHQAPRPHQNHWTEKDCVLISYGDSIIERNRKPLATLLDFVQQHLGNNVSVVHLLPYFPYTSDDGFAVLDYYQVNDSLGDWQDIEAFGNHYRLMSDLVINHCSSRSGWFNNFRQGLSPGKDYFIEIDSDWDLSKVIRPRTNALSQTYRCNDGERQVWCTFSRDQVDFNFANPEVLLEFISIIRFYLDKQTSVFRLDAIAFLWKTPGTNCLNLTNTHRIIRLLRLLIEHANPAAWVITETNIPNRENLSYFGNANEAHGIYNFALPPLLLHTLLSQDCSHLRNWSMSMPPAQNGTFFLNFIASHDGIGLRPVEHIFSATEVDELIETVQQSGGLVSWRNLTQDQVKPYEINVSLFDALARTHHSEDSYQRQRFLCAHTIMLSLEGIPAIYIHSFLGTQNDYDKVQHSNHNRSINRHRWQLSRLQSLLQHKEAHHGDILAQINALISIRRQQSAFHPNATQFTLQLGNHVFGVWRQSIDRKQSIFCVSNVTSKPQRLSLSELNLIETNLWHDLLSQQDLNADNGVINLAPYQSLWLSN